jgi:ribose/xylose/arabinose/galactoside ABC-type transport system permease subunit
MEFQAVATVVIGGTSLFGGRGGVLPGTLAGVFLLVVITNGLGTLGVSPLSILSLQAGLSSLQYTLTR